jgi:hypothetical protein
MNDKELASGQARRGLFRQTVLLLHMKLQQPLLQRVLQKHQ